MIFELEDNVDKINFQTKVKYISLSVFYSIERKSRIFFPPFSTFKRPVDYVNKTTELSMKMFTKDTENLLHIIY